MLGTNPRPILKLILLLSKPDARSMLGNPALANLHAPRPTPNLSNPYYLILDPDSNPT